jgi:hypothetical protein
MCLTMASTFTGLQVRGLAFATPDSRHAYAPVLYALPDIRSSLIFDLEQLQKP